MDEEVFDIPHGKCLICSKSIKAPRYGIDACRACASFFKRTKIAGKAFICRRGSGQCVIVKDEKFCRKCRFDRCVAAGLVYECGLPFDPNSVKTEQSLSKDEMSPSTSLESAESILQRIGRLFNASVERRRKKELQLLQNRPDSILVPHPSQEIYMGTYATSLLTFQINLEESRPIFEKSFPAIKELSIQEQDLLCTSYFPKFCAIDNAFRTRKVWGEIKRFGMGSVLSAADFSRLDLWLGDEQGGRNRQSLINWLHAQNQVQVEIVDPMMVRAQITLKEFYALIALVLCEVEPCFDVSEQTLSILDTIRAEVFDDLQRYYKEEMGLSDFSIRLGNLVSLNHVIQECISASIEFVRLQQALFDLYSVDDISKEIYELFVR